MFQRGQALLLAATAPSLGPVLLGNSVRKGRRCYEQAFGAERFEDGEGIGGAGYGADIAHNRHDSLAVAWRFRINTRAKRERVNWGRSRPFVPPLDTRNEK
jgi:hypothetical protein